MRTAIANNEVRQCHVFNLSPLSDFIADHSLLSNDPKNRLSECCARWSQFVTGLWHWRHRAAFCLRYVAGIIPGRVDVFLLAKNFTPTDYSFAQLSTNPGFLADLIPDHGSYELLRNDLEVLLRNHRFWREIVDDEDQCPPDINPCDRLKNPAVLEITQFSSADLWQPTADQPSSSLSADGRSFSIYPWWGPGGPFLLPLQALVTKKTPVFLSVFLQPTELFKSELDWFQRLINEANKANNPLANRLYAANFRRLLANPFLVSVQCAVGDSQEQVLDMTTKETIGRNVAASIQALVHEEPFERQFSADDHLPSGSKIKMIQNSDHSQFSDLGFKFQGNAQLSEDSRLQRLPYLVDALGATTVFRLPVSVNGGVPGIRVRQQAPDFNPGPRNLDVPPGDVLIGRFNTGGLATVKLETFLKHSLITGFTGSGKTYTVLSLLDQFWRDHEKPFLVIESAKSEYRGLLAVEDRYGAKRQFMGKENRMPIVRVYTLGNELCAPFRFNPFELFPGVRLEAHIGRLQTCFAAAVSQEGPLPGLIFDALVQVYTAPQFGWHLTDIGPDDQKDPRRFPRLRDFCDMILSLIKTERSDVFPKGRGYKGELLQNLSAYVFGRISVLLDGSKGRMFDVDRSISPKELFEHPTILELNDLNGPDKSLVTMLLLMMLREYREGNKSSKLQHITVVEEAHNILARSGGPRTGSDQPDTAGQTVNAFSNLLSEIRALGEGLIIADQSPEKLAADAMRNTNVQIAHQLRDGHDREAIANAMLMTKEQCDFLGKIRTGWAAVFFQGLEKATFVKVPNYKDCEPDDPQSGRGAGFKKHLSDDAIRDHMKESLKDVMAGPLGDRCKPCGRKCEFRKYVLPGIGESNQAWFNRWKEDYSRMGDKPSDSELQSAYEELARFLLLFCGCNTGLDAGDDACWCVFQHLYGPKLGDQAFASPNCYRQIASFLDWARRHGHAPQQKREPDRS